MMLKSQTIIDPIPPGEVLREEFLLPHALSATAFAKRLGVPANRITRVINGEASVTAETAIMLAAALGTTPQFWLNLQTQYDLERARLDPAIAKRLRAIKPVSPELAA